MTVIVADSTIPYLDYFFAEHATIHTYPATEITSESLNGADILLVRSKTQVNQQLLKNTSVRFVGSCVSGTDHLMLDELSALGIAYHCALGCNRYAVMEYVLGVLALLRLKKQFVIENKKVAVIGVGQVGTLVAELFEKLGANVLRCDPFQENITHVPLDKIKNCALIACHTPLTRSGPYPTDQMLDQKFFARQAPNCVLINAGRGGVVNPKGVEGVTFCLDVWPNEPEIDPELLQLSFVATPHIAGHSTEGKLKGTEQVYQAAAKVFNWPAKQLPAGAIHGVDVVLDNMHWPELVESVLNLERMTLTLKKSAQLAEAFKTLRQSYPPRPSFNGIFKEHCYG